MSTTIFNGCRLPAVRSLPATTRALNDRFGEVFRPLAAETVALVAAVLISAGPGGAAAILGPLTAGQVKPEELYVSSHGTVLDQSAEITDRVQEALRRPLARRLPGLDLTFSAAFMNDPEDSQHLYATIYTEHDAYCEAWAGVTGAEPFPYWDNSGPPDDMTAEE